MEKKIYDCIVIGGGPSGITASVYLSRKKFDVLMIYDKLGGRTLKNPGEPDYVGFSFITGEQFVKKFEEQSEKNKIHTKDEKVIDIIDSKNDNERFVVKTDKGEYFSKSVIIASGSSPRKLNIPGEKEFVNKGVSYCATCDAPLFNGKNVAIIGSANFAVKEAILLENYAKKIYIVTENEKLCADKSLIERVKKMPNAEIMCAYQTLEIKGDKFVNEIIIEKVEDKKKKNLNVKGVFIRLGYIPNSFFTDVKKNDDEEIIINDKNETSVKGIFASGDVTNVKVKQIIVAAGEGAKAAISTAEYLELLKNGR